MSNFESKSNISNNENKHNKIIVCYFSDDTFNGFQVCIETEKLNFDNLESSIITYCFNELYNHLKTFRFDILLGKLNQKKNLFHIHEHITLPLISNNPIYICCH